MNNQNTSTPKLIREPSILTTTLEEIKSFSPCEEGLERFIQYWGMDCKAVIPFTELVKSNTFSDICWLLGKRKIEIEIAVRAAELCAASVKHLKNIYTSNAATAAAAAATAAATYATYAAATANAATAYAATYANANAAYAATYAATATAIIYGDKGYNKQTLYNLSCLFQAVEEFQRGEI